MLIHHHQKLENINLAWLRKRALNFEKKISKNAELRAKYEDSPEKYVQVIYYVVYMKSNVIEQVYGL